MELLIRSFSRHGPFPQVNHTLGNHNVYLQSRVQGPAPFPVMVQPCLFSRIKSPQDQFLSRIRSFFHRIASFQVIHRSNESLKATFSSVSNGTFCQSKKVFGWSHCGSLDQKDKKRVGEGIASAVDSSDFVVDSTGPVPYALYSDPDRD